jgi:hypothetical protein
MPRKMYAELCTTKSTTFDFGDVDIIACGGDGGSIDACLEELNALEDDPTVQLEVKVNGDNYKLVGPKNRGVNTYVPRVWTPCVSALRSDLRAGLPQVLDQRRGNV